MSPQYIRLNYTLYFIGLASLSAYFVYYNLDDGKKLNEHLITERKTISHPTEDTQQRYQETLRKLEEARKAEAARKA